MTGPKRTAPARRRNRPSGKKAPARIVAIPERGLKIGEAARVLGVETFVLRFWETQFPFLKPKHSRTKHRFYHERDLQVLRLIERLLHRDGFTIAGANKHIKEASLGALLAGGPAAKPHPPAASEAPSAPQPVADRGQTKRILSEVRRDLESIHKILEH
ncbi:MAG: MerR family transcriptional regulator [Candidatus Binataceae bacterium]